MTHRLWIPLSVATIAGLPALSATAGAQGASVSAVSVTTNHALLGDRLAGGAARVSIPLGGGRLSARLSAERLSGNSHRTGSPCSGLVRPGTCQPEPLRDDARLTIAAGGLGLGVLTWRGIDVKVAADLRLAWARADTRGLTSGGSQSASKSLWGGDVGLEGHWSPWTRLPLALEVGVAAGGLWPVAQDVVFDGYTPFEVGFDIRRLRLGVAWRPWR